MTSPPFGSHLWGARLSTARRSSFETRVISAVSADSIPADERKYWRDVAMAVARIARKRAGFDTATRMAIEADFSDRHESAGPELEPRKVDPIEELKRLIGDAETDPAHRAKVRNFSHHLRRPRGRR